MDAKKGLVKFGSRTRLLDPKDPMLGHAITLMKNQEEQIHAAVRALRNERVTLFFEYFGSSSFAGSHTDPLDQMSVALLDLHLFKHGLIEPQDVLELAQAGKITTPKLLHKGRVGPEFLHKVRQGTLENVTFEGVVGKGPFVRKKGGPVCFKWKSQAWFDRLRQHCGDDQKLFELLA